MPPLLPAWLCAASSLAKEVVAAAAEEEGEVDQAAAPWVYGGLPVCELECTDGELYYCTLNAWGVDWPDVPFAHFLPAWFSLCNKRRKQLLRERKGMFAEEIGGDWVQHMIDRDDDDMLAAVLDHCCVSRWDATLLGPKNHQKFALACAKAGAVRCAEMFLTVPYFAAAAASLESTEARALVVCAAKHGNLTLLEILLHGRHRKAIAVGIRFNFEATLAAARCGQLACLQLLLANNCSWRWRACLQAAPDPDTREWILQNKSAGHSLDEIAPLATSSITRSGDLATRVILQVSLPLLHGGEGEQEA